MTTFFLQEEREKEENRLQEIMEENNRKILEAQRKLVRVMCSFSSPQVANTAYKEDFKAVHVAIATEYQISLISESSDMVVVF